MIRIIYVMIEFIANVVSFFVPYKICRLINYFFKRVYSQCVTKVFQVIGKGAYIEYPAVINGGKHITIGNNFNVGARIKLDAFSRYGSDLYTPQIVIGDNVNILYDCHIGCVNRIVIGDNVLIASKVLIIDHSHGETTRADMDLPPSMRKVVSKGPIVIEDNVWIGENVAILSNVRIGKNSIIGANSVVTKDIPPYGVVAGNPAKIVKRVA